MASESKAVIYAAMAGNPVFDGVVFIVIGLILAGAAVWLAVETRGLLIGESANRRVVEDIRETVGHHTQVEAVNEVLTMHMGPDFILVNISVRFNQGMPAKRLERVFSELDRGLKQQHKEIKRVFIEAESSLEHRERSYRAT